MLEDAKSDWITNLLFIVLQLFNLFDVQMKLLQFITQQVFYPFRFHWFHSFVLISGYHEKESETVYWNTMLNGKG